MDDPLENSNSMSTWMVILVWQGSEVRIVCKLLIVLTPVLIWKCQLCEFLTKDYQNNLVSIDLIQNYLESVQNTVVTYKKVLYQFLVCRIWDLWRFWMIPSYSKSKRVCNLMLASFGFFGHRGWIQPLALTAEFHSSLTIRNFKKLQYKRFKAIKNLK